MKNEALAPDSEHEALRDSVRRLLADKSELAELRRPDIVGASFDRAVWRLLCDQIGVQSLLIPDEYGGLGQGMSAAAVVFEELGRALYRGPMLGTVGLAVPALLAAGDRAACGEILPSIASGTVTATLAVADSDGRWDPGRERVTSAVHQPDGWHIDGTKDIVIDGTSADQLLLTAQTYSGASLFAVDSAAEGLTRTALPSLDLSRNLARIDLDFVSARLIGKEGAADDVVANVYELALTHLAAEQAGGTTRCMELSVDYAKQRYQFGAPIGSFQAIAHKCVDMLHESEFARATAQYAAACADAADPEFPLAARVASAYCSRAYRRVSTEMIQVFGGIGFTWEHDAHLYYRRAWSDQQLLGRPSDDYLAIATRAGL